MKLINALFNWMRKMNPKRKIYDCFIVYNEVDLLELRLEILYPDVDVFVIIEATETFSGYPKSPFFECNLDRFKRFQEKIRYILIDDLPDTPNAWIREAWQRNAMMRGLNDVQPDDIIIFSDVDEIPRISKIINHDFQDNIWELEQNFYYYKINLHCGLSRAAFVIQAQNLILTPQEMRQLPRKPRIVDAGWHFSYLFSPEGIQNKIKAFSHQEYNKEEFTNIDHIKKMVEERKDLFGRDSSKMYIQNDYISYPDHIKNNLEAYSHLFFDFKNF
nr:hypothetical protein [Eilatimonas milleporae]